MSAGPTPATPSPAPAAPVSPVAMKRPARKAHIWVIIGLSIATVLATTVAVIQSVRSSETKTELDELSAELDEKVQLVTKYAAMLGLNASQNNNPNMSPNPKPGNDDDDDADSTTPELIASSDYIYIGEWGIKIKIPEGLKGVSYLFESNTYQIETDNGPVEMSTDTIYVSAILDDMTYIPDAFKLTQNPTGLGLLTRHYSPSDLPGAQYIGKIDEYYYSYAHPQAVFSVDETEQQQELSAANLIKDMLSDLDNITKF